MIRTGKQSSRLKPGFTHVLLTLLLLAATFTPVRAEKTDEAKNTARLEQLRERITKLRHGLKKAHSKKSKVQTDLRKMDQSIGQINRKLRRLRTKLKEQKKNLRGLYQQQGQLRKGLSKHRSQLASQVRASYVMGRQEQLKIVLNQGDPSTVQRALVYFDYLNRSRSEQINEVIAQLKELQQVEQQIEKQKLKLESLSSQQAERKQALLKTRSARKKILSTISREIVSKDKQLGRMLQNEKELQAVLRAVESLGDITAAKLDGKPFAKRKGSLPWPANGRIRAKFGSTRASGGLRWSGMLIDAKSGEDISAIARGRIAFTDWLRGYGLLVIIDHGDGYMSLYGHNQSVFKEIGEWVEEGDTIASVGSSGGQSRSQLYFELRHNGKPVNPIHWCRRTRDGIVSLR